MKKILFIATILTALMMFPHFTECTVFASSSASLPRNYLEGNELEIYQQILRNIISISKGERDAESFYINVSKPFDSESEYKDAIKKAMFFINNYAPEYLYWNDGRGYYVYNTVRCRITYGISPAFQEFGNKYKISAKKLNYAQKALSNAKEIADKYQEKSDYEKVWGYAEEICALSSYNHYAADNDDEYYEKNTGPWNILYVFDRDSSTNVVCGGYARAFQYLCSLGGVECHYITGYIKEGYHAWNIVVIDGKNYFVDLTVCSQYSSGDILRNHPYVMNSVKSSNASSFKTYYSDSGIAHSHSYTYHENEQEYLPESLRVLTTKAYSKKPPTIIIMIVVFLAIEVVFLLVKRKRKCY